MADKELARLNDWIRRRAVARGEVPSVLCEHCDRVAEVSVTDPRRCAVCAPLPAVGQRLAWEVRSRVRQAVQAASHGRWAA
jgi:hypothetical protein